LHPKLEGQSLLDHSTHHTPRLQAGGVAATQPLEAATAFQQHRTSRLAHLCQGLGLQPGSSLLHAPEAPPCLSAPLIGPNGPSPPTSARSQPCSDNLSTVAAQSDPRGAAAGGTCGASPNPTTTFNCPDGRMISRQSIAFDGLRFTKPSRMMAVYIAFTCTLQRTGGASARLHRSQHKPSQTASTLSSLQS
jgi:hypothetical protein